jgi:hypothetical protein
MSTRELVSNDGRIITYRVRNDTGTPIGWDHELILTVAEANETTLRQRAQNALTANATYLARTAPTTAQKDAQIAQLTRECSALIRLLLNQTDSTDGT